MEQQPFKRVGQENFTTSPKDTGSASKKRGLKTLNEEREDARTHWCGIVVGSRASPGRDFLRSQSDTGTEIRSLRPGSGRRSDTASSRTRRCPSRSARRRTQAGTRTDSRLPSPGKEREKESMRERSQS